MSEMTPADVAAVTRDGYDGFGFGGGSGIWLFAILALLWGGNGMFGNRGGYANAATVEDLNTTTNFARLEGQVRANENYIQSGFTNLGNGICQLGYQLATDKGELSKQISECCCGINRNIDSVRYEAAINTAAINANTTAGIQKVLDRLCEDKISGQAATIQKLELERAMCGVVKYPTSATYFAPFPYQFNNCCTSSF